MHRNTVLGAVLLLAIGGGLPTMAADRLDPQLAEPPTPPMADGKVLMLVAISVTAVELLAPVQILTRARPRFFRPRRQVLLPAFNTTLDYFATARVRLGYAFGNFLPYVTGGAAWGQSKVEINDSDGNAIASKSATRFGWVAGGGFEYAIDRHWSANIEYNYIDLGTKSYNLGNIAPTILEIDPRFHIVKLGLNYKLDDAAPNDTFVPTAPESNNWNVHAQTTFIQQGYPGFRSPYEGAKSLPGVGLGRETWTVTAFLGWRLWEGGEFYFNPELAQGFGIGSTLGLAGFSNGEAPEGRRPVSQDSCAALFSPTNLWVWRRAGRRRRRSQSTAG